MESCSQNNGFEWSHGYLILGLPTSRSYAKPYGHSHYPLSRRLLSISSRLNQWISQSRTLIRELAYR